MRHSIRQRFFTLDDGFFDIDAERTGASIHIPEQARARASAAYIQAYNAANRLLRQQLPDNLPPPFTFPWYIAGEVLCQMKVEKGKVLPVSHAAIHSVRSVLVGSRVQDAGSDDDDDGYDDSEDDDVFPDGICGLR
ncbi:hypothetical protein CBR_g21112 [Chara braunii]|uniref:Uncharacterized protein n=1 Tax=Chara braunii TaxID=69332 RepID=A0A388L0T7_CHABU|nr:hypothetical protein CBR_g21112 [Chara braunii]|eukprot:GBG75868.1 hypothetical protein CBR_g21112 [Chara braunii]